MGIILFAGFFPIVFFFNSISPQKSAKICLKHADFTHKSLYSNIIAQQILKIYYLTKIFSKNCEKKTKPHGRLFCCPCGVNFVKNSKAI